MIDLSQIRQSLRGDVVAGFTVAMVGIPQCMAYAAIAGVAPVYGLYTGIIPTIFGSLFGSSGYLITGPSNATALVTANVLLSVATRESYAQFVFALAMLSGLIKLVLGVLNLGWIIRYVSHSVLMGFLTGATVLIVLGQLTNLMGLPRASGAEPLLVLWHTLTHLPSTNLHVLATGLLTIALLLLCKRANAKLPAELLSIVLAACVVALLGWSSHGVLRVGDLGVLHVISLDPHIPGITIQEWQALLPSAGAVALFSLVEAMSIGRAVGLSAGERIQPSREFIGQGVASLVGGLLQCIPSSGSPSRTAVNYSSGAKTRLAGVCAGIIVLLGLVVFGPLLDFIPIASLAGVVIVTAYNLVDRHQLRLTWQSQATSRAVFSVTLLATFVLPLHYAIYLGGLLSIGVYVYTSSQLQLSYITQNPAGGYVEHRLDDILRFPPSIAIVNVEGTLSFGAAEDLEQRVDQIIRSGVRVVVLRLRRVRRLGSTGVAALERIVTYGNRSGTRVLVCGVREDVKATLRSSGVEAMIGEDGVFKASDVLFASTQEALARAQEIVMEKDAHWD